MPTPLVTLDELQTTDFPQTEVEKCLREELTGVVRQQATVRGETLPNEAHAILTKTIHIDSLGVVEILCVLDGVLPFRIDDSVVRAGGYTSIQDAITDLIPKIGNRWRKQQGNHEEIKTHHHSRQRQ